MDQEKFILEEIWNERLERNDRKPEPRLDRVYASELGGAMIDRYLKMKGTAYTNPPNSRALRKMQAGNLWEFIVRMVIVMGGVHHKSQKRARVQIGDLLPVSGKADFIVGGDFKLSDEKVAILTAMLIAIMQSDEEGDEEQIDKAVEFMLDVAKLLKDRYEGKVIADNVIEVKSLGSFMFEMVVEEDNPRPHHILQASIYREHFNLPTDIIYVSRDDVRIKQYNIDSIHPEAMKLVEADLKQITAYIKDDVQPQPERLILWDATKQKFTKNWKVEYSNYLTMLYGYKKNDDDKELTQFTDAMEYYEWSAKITGGLNRVITKLRAEEGTKQQLAELNKQLDVNPFDKELVKKEKALKKKLELTGSNQEWIAKMTEYGYPLETLTLTPKVARDKEEVVEPTEVITE